MLFLHRRRSVDPFNSPSANRHSSSKEKDKQSNSRHPVKDLPNAPRNRTSSDASVFRRVSTMFATRRRTLSKGAPSRGDCSGSGGIEFICSNPLTRLPRISSDSTPPSSPEIRRPSGLGRRASFLESDFNDSVRSVAVSDIYRVGEGPRARAGFSSLPNLLDGGGLRLSETFNPKVGFETAPQPEAHHPTRRAGGFALPNHLLEIVLQFLPRRDLIVTALVSRDFCSTAQHTLYHSLDTRSIAESQLKRLYSLLSYKRELAELVFSFYCPLWPILPDCNDTPDVFCRALHNMVNLRILTIHSFTSVLSHTPSPIFSLTQLTILDTGMTQSQLTEIRLWLTTQSSLQSLAFPNLAEYQSDEGSSPQPTDEWTPLVARSSTEGEATPPIASLPALKSLHASTQIIGSLCSSLQHPLHRLTLEVHDTLYTGLRPSVLLRPFKGVRELSIIFAPEVDKRTAEKFLGVTGYMLAGEDNEEGLTSLEIETLWMDKDSAETLYGIVTATLSRFRGLQKLKLTSPFRSIQAPIRPPAATLSLLPFPSPLPSPTHSVSAASAYSVQSTPSANSILAFTPQGVVIEREFVNGTERGYAKTWTSRCPTLEDVQFTFSCSMNETDVELCGVWFRRKVTVGGMKSRRGEVHS